jgi:hypothetical protein
MLTATQDNEEIIERVAALDIGKAELMCCVRVPDGDHPGKRLQEVQAYATMTRSVLGLADHLGRLGVTRVVMAATTGRGRFTGWRPRRSSACWPTPGRSRTCPAVPSGTRPIRGGWPRALSAARSLPASWPPQSSGSSGCTPGTGGT